MNRRTLITSGIASSVAAPFALDAQVANAGPGAPPYTISINIELMFPRTMPRAQRVQMIADQGFKAYSFWNASEEDQDAMLKVQQKTGLKCASITGPGSLGSSTGLTKPGQQQAYLDEIAARVKMAVKFGGAQPIIFVGRTQTDVPWETQRAQIVSGLKLCGDIAKAQGITL